MLLANFHGDPNIGLYGFATDRYFLVGAEQKAGKKMAETVGVRMLHSRVLQTGFAGIFCAGNSDGIAVPRILEDYELGGIRQIFERVLVLDTDFTAVGNLMLLNDSGIIISPLLRKNIREIKEFFGLPCGVSKIAGSSVTGAMAAATNNGCLACPGIRKSEITILEDILGVELGVGTVSFGSPFVKAGLVANSSGFVASDRCTGPELGRISEALGF